MKYKDDNNDLKLRSWFNNDYTQKLLKGMTLKDGEFRGLSSFSMKFKYPITAIAGKNGAGKSTILALACCGYHNETSGFKLPKRKTSYYTFSDFFIQHTDEIPPQGIKIEHHIAHDKWKKSEKYPNGEGVGKKTQLKKKGGRWSDYAKRTKRNVIFLGIERLVPHSERSQSRSYSKAFKTKQQKGWEEKVKNAVGYVLGKSYDEFKYSECSVYNLPIVQIGATTYSGFNMGAGENALFEIFSIIYSCGKGALLVIDEIELGLHVEAQKTLLRKLKEVCLETKTQIICTTHSKEIFDCLPYDARYFVENISGKTKITDSVSSNFAFSKMSATTGLEMTLLVEDETAEKLLMSVLPCDIRTRITISYIGSSNALVRYLASLYLNVKEKNNLVLVIFDGDQQKKENDLLKYAKEMVENPKDDFDNWFKSRIEYLPGDTWPEKWLIEKSEICIGELSKATKCSENNFSDILKAGGEAGKHSEFFEISKQLSLERDFCLQIFAATISEKFPAEFEHITKRISEILSNETHLPK